LKALAELQKVDLDVVALRKSAEVYPKQMGELERELSLARSEVEAERTKLLDVERQRRTLEQNISEEKEKVRKWEARLAEQRSTREYAALAREIDIAKKANTTMAEELVELGKIQVQLREVVKTKDQQYAAKVADIGAKLNELRGKAAAFEGQVKELEGKRAEVAKTVHPPLLSRYEAVRRRRSPALVTERSASPPGSAGLGCVVPSRRSAAIAIACARSGERRNRPRLTSPYTGWLASTTLQGMKEYSRAQPRALSTWSGVMIPCRSTSATSDCMSVSRR